MKATTGSEPPEAEGPPQRSLARPALAGPPSRDSKAPSIEGEKNMSASGGGAKNASGAGGPNDPTSSAASKKAKGGTKVLVLSDVDDTIKCSAGPPGGIDKRFGKHDLYPGVLQLYMEIGRSGDTAVPPPSVVLMSARPKIVPTLQIGGEDDVVILAKRLADGNDLGGAKGWGIDLEKAQYGRLKDFAKDYLRDVDLDKPSKDWNLQSMAGKKYQSWDRNIKGRDDEGALPTVFFGDDGQGDVMAGMMMFKRMREAGSKSPIILATFIHLVNTVEKLIGYKAFPLSEKIGITYFNTHAEAAVRAMDLGLLGLGGVKRVHKAIKESAAYQICEWDVGLEPKLGGYLPCFRELSDGGRKMLVTHWNPANRRKWGNRRVANDGTVHLAPCQTSWVFQSTYLINPATRPKKCDVLLKDPCLDDKDDSFTECLEKKKQIS